MDVVRTIALSRVYTPDTVAVHAVNDLSLSIGEGELVAIMGASGCGKTTLLHLLGGLDRASSGQVLIDGVDLAVLSDSARTRLRGSRMGFVFQRFNLVPTLTALGNLRLAARIKKVDARPESLTKLLELVGVEHKANVLPGRLSIGEQQRVTIARALVGDPRLLLADEPTGSLDSENSVRVLRLFRDINKRLNQTTVMITHSEEAASYAHRIVRMRDGRIVGESRPSGALSGDPSCPQL